MGNSFYSDDELKDVGFKSVGVNVKISRYARIYGADSILIGDNVRIDDFCILSGRITIGNYVHIAAYTAIFAGDTGVTINDFAGLSSRCAIYAESDDYSGNHLTNPTVDEKYLGIIKAPVMLKRHTIVGTGSTILPGVCIGEGSAVGSMSLVTKNLDEWGIFAGVPCRYIKARSKKLLELEKQYAGERKMT